MKKDIIAVLAVVLIIAVLACGVEIQSVDEYYLTHIDDIKPDSKTVFLSIKCDSILKNQSKADPALISGGYIPENGVILEKAEYVLRENDTVYDILERVLRYKKIPFERRGSSASVYIAGINSIYEYSCGPLSGWMYSVNGIFSEKSCAEYVLSDGDVIEWVYSCELGHDVREKGGQK